MTVYLVVGVKSDCHIISPSSNLFAAQKPYNVIHSSHYWRSNVIKSTTPSWSLLYLRLQLRFIQNPVAWYVAQYTIKKSQTHGAWILLEVVGQVTSGLWGHTVIYCHSHQHGCSGFNQTTFWGTKTVAWSLITEHVAAISLPVVMPPTIVWWNDAKIAANSAKAFVLLSDTISKGLKFKIFPALLCNAFNLIISNLVATALVIGSF